MLSGQRKGKSVNAEHIQVRLHQLLPCSFMYLILLEKKKVFGRLSALFKPRYILSFREGITMRVEELLIISKSTFSHIRNNDTIICTCI